MKSFKVGEFQCTRELGKGGQGTVYLGIDPNGRRLAVKTIVKDVNDKEYEQAHKGFVREVDALERTDHPNIIKIVYAQPDATWIQDGKTKTGDVIVTELAPRGELFDLIVASDRRLEEPIAKYAFKQMLAALEYLHRCGIANRDIKLPNMLVGDSFQILMADFGMQHKLQG